MNAIRTSLLLPIRKHYVDNRLSSRLLTLQASEAEFNKSTVNDLSLHLERDIDHEEHIKEESLIPRIPAHHGEISETACTCMLSISCADLTVSQNQLL